MSASIVRIFNLIIILFSEYYSLWIRHHIDIRIYQLPLNHIKRVTCYPSIAWESYCNRLHWQCGL